MNAQQWHNTIYEISKQTNLDVKQVFKAIYMVILGKDSGPRAGWLLASLDDGFLWERFLNASYVSYGSPYALVYWLLSEEVRQEGRTKQGRKRV